ncbi:hypothetical protein Plhal703r1_c23g0096741 [Plasmopara halstedii]
MSLAELWEHSELQLTALPAPHQLVELLQKPLPFKLMLRDPVAAGGVFIPDGPLLTCPDLALMMDNILYMCISPPEGKASENSWREYYNALLRISNSLCRDRGFRFRGFRNLADKTETTILRKRPDYIFLYKGLRSPVHLGLRYIRDDIQVVAIERSDGPFRATMIVEFSVLEDRAGALKILYNLALLLHQMAKLTKRSYACDLEPFVPDENEKRKIVLLDGSIERTIKHTQSGGEMDVERLKSVYETLRGLDEGSPITHLQTVEKLNLMQDGR